MPLADSMRQAIDTQQQKLQMKAQQILTQADTLHQKISEDSQKLIEHRTQTMQSHACRIEQLILVLEKIIQLLKNNLSQPDINPAAMKQRQYLTKMMTEAQKTQQTLEQPPQSINAGQIKRQILTIDQHRQRYEKSLCGWCALFSKNRSDSQSKEKINNMLKNNIAELIIPVSGLFDMKGVVDHFYLKAQKQKLSQLTVIQEKVTAEQKKVDETKIRELTLNK